MRQLNLENKTNFPNGNIVKIMCLTGELKRLQSIGAINEKKFFQLISDQFENTYGKKHFDI